LYVVVGEVVVPIWVKLLHDGPAQRSTEYWLMVPPVSEAPDQLRLICVLENTVAARFDGAVKVGAGVVVLAMLE
jgi:hypothetical protein